MTLAIGHIQEGKGDGRILERRTLRSALSSCMVLVWGLAVCIVCSMTIVAHSSSTRACATGYLFFSPACSACDRALRVCAKAEKEHRGAAGDDPLSACRALWALAALSHGVDCRVRW